MDISTAKDYIEDLQTLVSELHIDIRRLETACKQAFANGHLEGCNAGLACSCGYTHYYFWKDSKK